PDPLAIARRMEQDAAGSRPAMPPRALREIVVEPRARIAVSTLMLSQIVMIGTTSTSPVYLHDHGHSVSTIGLAVSMHLGGMYVASPLSGWLCDRFGRVPMIGAGGLGLLLAVAVAGLAPAGTAGPRHSPERGAGAMRRTLTTLIALLCVLTACAAHAQTLPTAKPEDVGLSTERLGRITARLRADAEKGIIPGTVLLVAR